MAAVIQKNETVSTLRQIDIGPIFKTDGLTIAPVETDFVALGNLYVTNPSDPQHLKLGTGTCVNKRRPVVIADDVVESVDTGADTLELTAHNYKNLDGPLTAPGIDAGNQFWVIRVDDNNIAVASSLANAIAGTREPLAGTETGTTISDSASTTRGIPGEFVYTFTQAETNVSVTELWVVIDGGDYERPYGGGKATANLGSGGDGWSTISSEGLTNQQKLNIAARNAAAPFSKTDNDFVWRKLDDSGDSHSATVTSAGRSDVDIIDPD